MNFDASQSVHEFAAPLGRNDAPLPGAPRYVNFDVLRSRGCPARLGSAPVAPLDRCARFAVPRSAAAADPGAAARNPRGRGAPGRRSALGDPAPARWEPRAPRSSRLAERGAPNAAHSTRDRSAWAPGTHLQRKPPESRLAPAKAARPCPATLEDIRRVAPLLPARSALGADTDLARVRCNRLPLALWDSLQTAVRSMHDHSARALGKEFQTGPPGARLAPAKAVRLRPAFLEDTR